MKQIIGTVSRVSGPVVQAEGVTQAYMLELVEVGDEHLLGEIMRLDRDRATIQVYEETTGLKPGAPVFGTGAPLSVELGPGLLGNIYDGVQRPLEALRNASGHFIQRGIQAPALDREKRWHFVPRAQKGQAASQGTLLGVIPETNLIEHRVLVPPDTTGTLLSVASEGDYQVEDTIAEIETQAGVQKITLVQRWPVRVSRPAAGRLRPDTPLVSGQRVVDTLFPIAKGGTVAIPGGFGTGKTMTQHAIAKWCDAEVIVYIGCGERGNEMTDVLLEFPKLQDPRSGRPLMERTILLANTSNMPVAAREASIYTGITLAEYYRDMGYDTAIMADSTSRWAEALRELSGRMEEMPAEEGFPAYLPTRLAEFYERAGRFETLSGEKGSITIIGAVSPPGGDVSEPVTQHTKRFIRAFWALDRELANARHYPAIGWMDSYSEYVEEVTGWWEENVDSQWYENRRLMMDLLQQEDRLQKVVKLVGADVLPDAQRWVLEVCQLFRNAFLQQNSFDKVDMFCVAPKQAKMLAIIAGLYRHGVANIHKGVTYLNLRKSKVLPKIAKMKSTIPNDQLQELDKINSEMERSMERLGAIYES